MRKEALGENSHLPSLFCHGVSNVYGKGELGQFGRLKGYPCKAQPSAGAADLYTQPGNKKKPQEEETNKDRRVCELSVEITRKVFGKVYNKDLEITVFPIDFGRFYVSPRLKDVLSPGENCAPSEFIVRLWNRYKEWHGRNKSDSQYDKFRGMPFNERPLDLDVIRQAKKWTELGCPWPGENLCRPCKHSN